MYNGLMIFVAVVSWIAVIIAIIKLKKMHETLSKTREEAIKKTQIDMEELKNHFNRKIEEKCQYEKEQLTLYYPEGNKLLARIEDSKKESIQKVRLHLLLDGRDVGPLTALDYVEKLEEFLKTQNDSSFDCQVASAGGRTFVTMDRYESDWSIVERGYCAHVLGEGRVFRSLKEAVETLRTEKRKCRDRFCWRETCKWSRII